MGRNGITEHEKCWVQARDGQGEKGIVSLAKKREEEERKGPTEKIAQKLAAMATLVPNRVGKERKEGPC